MAFTLRSQTSPITQRVKIETEGKEQQGSSEYVNNSGTRSVEVGRDYAGDQRKTVRRKKKDGSVKTTSRKISDKRAERIKKRKEKRLEK
tara:strand:- start:97 stop:363 length:267 start_codon:yes stop_codon:yes gene_type:complete